MLSIIISTYKSENFAAIKLNISATIGETKYEIIRINNLGEMSLSKAYNKGAVLANSKNLLFIHDDVQILSENWGERLVDALNLNNSGVVGLAGGTKKSSLPTGHDLGIEEYKFVSVIHDENEIKSKHIAVPVPVKIKTLDGVFLALKKKRWKEFKFNENLDGFHFYDLDISLRVSEQYQNYIVPHIFIRHFSKGKFNDSWIEASLKFHRNSYNFDSLHEREKDVVRKFWFRRLLKEDISSLNRLRYVYNMGMNKNCWKEVVNFLTARYL